MQILPVIALQPFIKHYLFLESKGDDIKHLRLFSDGNMGIVFSFKNNLLNDAAHDRQNALLPGSFLYGQISAFRNVCVQYKTQLVIVVFHPTGINWLTGIPAHELSDNIVDTGLVFGKRGEELYAQLAEAGNIQNMLSLLNNFFIQQAIKNTLPGNCFVSAALQLIIKSKGLISSNQLVKLTGYTERHIERKFNEYVGTTPKRFSNIVRLHVFLKELKAKGNSRNLTQIAYEAGYADQSHLIKEFKKITGMSPAIYQHNTDKLASNFVNLRIGVGR